MGNLTPRPSSGSVFEEFLVGANLPWFDYGLDFGASNWTRDGGIGRPEAGARLQAQLPILAQNGVRALRWFLFCDGRAGIRFDEQGCPVGIDDFVCRDVDAALAAAQRSGLRVLFVLLDFHWCKPRRDVHAVQLGGRAIVLEQYRNALLDRVLLPVFTRYADSPEILGWDLLNEPEWVASSGVRAYLKEAAALAHASASQPVTVGAAGTRRRRMYRNMELDFYQIHWYPRTGTLPPSARDLGFDKPVLLGEFATRDTAHAPAEILRAARDAGYAGAFYWSAQSNDRFSASEAGLEAARGWS